MLGTLSFWKDFDIIEGIIEKIRDNLQFYGRKATYYTIFSLP